MITAHPFFTIPLVLLLLLTVGRLQAAEPEKAEKTGSAIVDGAGKDAKKASNKAVPKLEVPTH